ncbi:uncharacterized protein CCR75_005706 [Bremia lactucae]|uniref:Uncharacterized protein n=1 Tax=Bremia lactucae TaxID=4779 RepID=A0A976NYC9_BRELC|nr:hypothetical protein CCR75_005706 [Bremia lactucae]
MNLDWVVINRRPCIGSDKVTVSIIHDSLGEDVNGGWGRLSWKILTESSRKVTIKAMSRRRQATVQAEDGMLVDDRV